MTSSGGGSEVCGCADTALAMMKEAKGNMDDKDKMEAIKKKYEAKMEKCEKILRPEGEEARKKVEEEGKNCASAKEIEKMREEMMKR